MPARLRGSPCRAAIAQLLRQTSHIIAVRERHMNRCIAPNTGVENRAGGTSGLNNNNSQQRPTPPNPRPRTTWLQDKSRPLALISRTHRSNITTGKRQHRNSNTHGASSSSSSSSPGAAAEAAPPPFPAASRLRLPPGLVGASPAAPASSFFLSSACVACFPTLRQSQNAATGRTLCRVVDGVGSKKKRTWGRITDVAGWHRVPVARRGKSSAGLDGRTELGWCMAPILERFLRTAAWSQRSPAQQPATWLMKQNTDIRWDRVNPNTMPHHVNSVVLGAWVGVDGGGGISSREISMFSQ